MGATAAFTIDPLTVTTLDDVMDVTDGKTSLREAIEYANQEGGNQTITFSNATDWLGPGSFGSGATLTLNPALGALNVTANITIDGSLVYGNGIDQGTLTISGGDAIQIFTIAAGGGMTISNMSLTGGNAGEGNGGAINNAGTLSLTNVNVSNSKAMNGGAIYSTGSLTVNGGTWAYIRGGNRRSSGYCAIASSDVNAKLNITINGGRFTNTADNLCTATGMSGFAGECVFTINGGTFLGDVYAVSRVGSNLSGKAYMSGKITMKVLGGTFNGKIGMIQDPSTITVTGTSSLVIASELKDKATGFTSVEVI